MKRESNTRHLLSIIHVDIIRTERLSERQRDQSHHRRYCEKKKEEK